MLKCKPPKISRSRDRIGLHRPIWWKWETLVRNQFRSRTLIQFGILQHVLYPATNTLWWSWYGWPCWRLRFGFKWYYSLIQGAYDPFSRERFTVNPKTAGPFLFFTNIDLAVVNSLFFSWSRDETCRSNWTYTSICFWILGWNRLYNWIKGIISR